VKHEVLFHDTVFSHVETQRTGIAVTLQVRIREVLGSNLSRVTSSDLSFFRGIPQSLQESARIPRLGHDPFLPNPHSSIILPFDAIYSLDTNSVVR
jgi:hypothetical protein